MSVLKIYQKSIFAVVAFAFVMMSAYAPSIAQTPVLSDEAISKALFISEKIENENLLTEKLSLVSDVNLEGLEPKEQLRLLRHYTQGAITLSNDINHKSLLDLYEQKLNQVGNKRDKTIFELQSLFLINIDLTKRADVTSQISTQLETSTQNDDWYEASTAWLLLSIQSSFADNHSLALQQAQTAYSLIPNELSSYVVDARISTLQVTTYLNNLMLDPERAIENTEKLILQKQEAGYPIDGMSLLNNLVFTLTNWREYEVSTHLAETIIRLEELEGSNIPGLTESRVAKLLLRQTKFDEALPYILRGLEETDIPVVRHELLFSEILALAGTENIIKAEEKLISFRKSVGDQYPDYIGNYFNSADAAISIAKKETKDAFYHNFLSQDAEIQSLLRRYNSNTSKLLASLESSKERQAERESALKREANQQRRLSQLLLVLVALLSLAAISAVIFARYRNKVSKELAIKTLEAEDADRMKSEFLGMVSHELRTPLNGIVGIADLLSLKAPTEDLRHKAGIILDSSNKLTHVIESIVDMSSIDGEKMELYPEPIDVHGIIMELDKFWRPTLEDKNVTFTSFVEKGLADDVILDKARFRQCVNNLLSNAAKFTDTGRVHLHVTSKPTDIDNEVEITAIVADTGQGMSEEVQSKLFTPFLQADSSMTRKHGGSGLGLTITQSLARMMQGDVTMVSNQGRGSEFTLTVKAQRSENAQILDDIVALMDSTEIDTPETEALPQANLPTPLDINSEESAPITEPIAAQYAPIQSVERVDINIAAEPTNTAPKPIAPTLPVPAPAPKPEPTQTSAYDAESLRGLKVLIVDDIPANQDVIKLFLVPEGCECHDALNGIEALKVLETQAIDIILMDIRMPEMDGIEATQNIRNSASNYKKTPIIALTADVSAETNAACMAAGADIFLSKPVMARELIESIKFIRRFQEYEEETATNVA